jgi:AcrR family transcriptional regulator
MAHTEPAHTSQGQQRREEILHAAFDVMSERGFRGTTLAIVAERVGLTQQGLMHYFPTKDELLAAALRARDDWDLWNLMHTRDHTVFTPELFAALMDYNAGRPNVVQAFTVLSAESVTEGNPARDYFTDRYATARAWTAQALEKPSFTLPKGLSPEQFAPILLAIFDGLQLQWLLDPKAVDMAALFRAFMEAITPNE